MRSSSRSTPVISQSEKARRARVERLRGTWWGRLLVGKKDAPGLPAMASIAITLWTVIAVFLAMTWLASLAPAVQTEHFRPSQHTGLLAVFWLLGGVLALLHRLAMGGLVKSWKAHGKPVLAPLLSVFWGVVMGQLFFLALFFTSVTQNTALAMEANAQSIQAEQGLGREQGWLDEAGTVLVSARPQWCIQARQLAQATPTQALAFTEGRELALVIAGLGVDRLRKNECITDAQWVERLSALQSLALENPSQSSWMARRVSWLPIFGHMSQAVDGLVERLRPTPAAMCARLLDGPNVAPGWNAAACSRRFEANRQASAVDIQAIREALGTR